MLFSSSSSSLAYINEVSKVPNVMMMMNHFVVLLARSFLFFSLILIFVFSASRLIIVSYMLFDSSFLWSRSSLSLDFVLILCNEFVSNYHGRDYLFTTKLPKVATKISILTDLLFIIEWWWWWIFEIERVYNFVEMKIHKKILHSLKNQFAHY